MKEVAVVYKVSALESYSAKHIRRHREMNPELGARMQSAHDDHSHALDKLRRILTELGVGTAFFERDGLSQNLDQFRLVISLGGDGTFINSSHFIEKTLLLGVNSSTENSVGHYCAFHLGNAKNEKLLKLAVAGLLAGKKTSPAPSSLIRMQVTLQGRPVGFPVLNDVLFCEENPAATARYTLRYKGKDRNQKSSGVWIATPTGSTAAYASAGGRSFTQKELRFIIRELYSSEGVKLREGKIKAGESLKIVSSMMHGALYLDGSHHKIPVALGEHISLSVHAQPLRAIY